MANQNDNDLSASMMTPAQLAARLKAGERFEVADDLPLRFDVETREAQDAYYERKSQRNSSDLDAFAGIIRGSGAGVVIWAVIIFVVWWGLIR